MSEQGLRDALEKLHDRLYATGTRGGKAIALQLDAILNEHPAEPVEPAVRITDEAVEQAKTAVIDAAEEKKRFEDDTWVEGLAGDFAAAALEAAGPQIERDSTLAIHPAEPVGVSDASENPKLSSTSFEVCDEAVEAALEVLFDDGHNGIKCYDPKPGLDLSVRAALEAAAPLLGTRPLPTREQIEELVNKFAGGPGRRGKAVHGSAEYPLDHEFRQFADAVLALMGGAE